MLWTKVTVKHGLFEYTDLSDSEFRAWIVLMLLTAELEKEPTREQMLNHVHHKTLSSLQDKFMKHSTTLQDIIKKVLEDAQEGIYQKERNKEKVKRFREARNNVTGYNTVTLPVRLDKIREDKIIKEKKEKIAKPEKIKFLDSVLLTQEQHDKLKATPGLDVDLAIEKLDYSITVMGRKYLDHYKVILNWHKRGFITKGESNVSTIGTNSNRSFTAKPSSINEAGDEEIRRMHEKWALLRKNANDKALRETEGNDVPDF